MKSHWLYYCTRGPCARITIAIALLGCGEINVRFLFQNKLLSFLRFALLQNNAIVPITIIIITYCQFPLFPVCRPDSIFADDSSRARFPPHHRQWKLTLPEKRACSVDMIQRIPERDRGREGERRGGEIIKTMRDKSYRWTMYDYNYSYCTPGLRSK